MLRIFLYCLLAALCVTGALTASLIYLPAFSEFRQSYVSRFLSESFEREIEVTGPVDISLGQDISVEVTDISVVPRLGGEGEQPERIDYGKFSLPFWSAFFGQGEIVALNLSGVDLEFAHKQEGTSRLDRFAEFPTRYLNRTLSGNLEIDDVTFRFVNAESGWNETIRIDNLVSSYNADESEIIVTAKGKFNTVALSFDARFQNPLKLAKGTVSEFSAELEIPGSTSQLSGTLDTSYPVAIMDAELSSKSESLGDLLDALGLKRVVEGTGTAEVNLKGPLDALSVSSLIAGTKGKRLEQVSVSGSIDNLAAATGFNLKFDARLSKPENKPASGGTFLDLSATGFSGQLTGDKGKFAIEQFFLNTNSLSFQLRDIGPISVGRVAKDDQGRLGIIGIHVLDGPAERPTLDLRGNVADALNLSGIDLAGKIDMPTVDALSLEGGENPELLGYLKGQISVSDQDGSLGVEELSGIIDDSELIMLELELKADDLADGDEIAINADLDIPDIAKFADALGASSAATGGLSFDGSFLVNDGMPGIEGELDINNSKISGRLAGKRNEGQIGATGSIKSKSVRVSDLRDLWEINLIRSEQDYDPVTVNDGAFAGFDLVLDIDVDKIVESGKSVGAFKGVVAYRDEVFNLDPFSLSYLNGRISTATTIDTSVDPAAISTSGSINRLALGRLLKELRLPEMASGTLSARFNMKGSGTDFKKVLANGNGRIDASLSGGVIQTNLLDLTGMNFVSWMFTQSREETTRLVCAVIPLNFKNGRASSNGIVLETKNVQAVGKGSIDIRGNRINLEFQPIPISGNAAVQPTPFKITGALSSPEISLEKGAMPQRMATEFFTAPLNALANIFGGNNSPSADTKNKPCVVRKVTN